MAYSYQTFNSGQVLTGGQAQQMEDNVRDHVHGKDGVVAAGASWQVTSRGSALTVASTDVGKLYECYGDFTVTFPTAGSLGGSFATAFKNMGSGRIALTAASGQWIEGNSLYALTPGESVIAQSDNSNLMLVGAQHGFVRLMRVLVGVSSVENIDLTHLYPGDFAHYSVMCKLNQAASAVPSITVSNDSGSSFLASGYTTTMGAETNGFRILDAAANSTQGYSEFVFTPVTSRAHYFTGRCVRGTSFTNPWTATQSNVADINAIRISGPFTSGCLVEVYGRGRPRAVV